LASRSSRSPPATILPALAPRNVEIREVLLELLVVDHRPDVRAGLERVIDPQRLHLLDHRLYEAVVDAFGHHQAARRRAALAGREERALDRRVDGDVEVRVVEHHLRVLAAHLELQLLQPFDGARARCSVPSRPSR
jgi:hypothetical protein